MQPVGHRRRAIALGVVLVLLMWCGGSLNLFRPFELDLQDSLASLRAAPRAMPPRVVIVEFEDEPASTSEWQVLLRALHELGANSVALSYPPRHTPGEPPPGLSLYVPVRQPVGIRPAVGTDFVTAHWRDDTLISAVPAPDRGISRWEASAYRVGDELWPTITWRLARGQGALPASDTIQLNFGGGDFPTVAAEAVLGSRLTPGVFEGRSIILGPRNPPGGLGLSTPLNPTDRVLTLSQFQAFAVQTWADNNAIHELPRWAVLLLLLGTGGLELLVFGLMRARYSLAYVVAVTLVTILFEWWLLQQYAVSMPGLEMGLFHVLLWLTLLRLRQIRMESELSHFAIRVATRANALDLPAGFFADHSPWRVVGERAKNLIEARRMAMLQVMPGGSLIVAWTWRCDAADFSTELHLSVEPFHAVLTARAPVLLLTQLLSHPDELEYLVPLIAGGRLHGFWLCAIPPHPDNVSDIEAMLAEQAHLLSALLEGWDDAHADSARMSIPLIGHSAAQFFRGSPVQQMLAKAARRMDGRLRLTDQIVQGAVVGLALHDPYGYLLLSNPAMQAWARRHRLRLDELTTAQFIEQFCGSASKARALLRRVHAGERIELEFPGDASAGRTIFSPVPAEGVAAALGLSGVLIEIRIGKATRDAVAEAAGS